MFHKNKSQMYHCSLWMGILGILKVWRAIRLQNDTCKPSISLSVLIYSKPPVELQMHPLNHFPIQIRIYINPWASITAIQHPSLSQQHSHAALLMWCSHQAESDFLVHVCHKTSSFVPLTVFPSSHLKWKLSLSSSSRHSTWEITTSPPTWRTLQHRCH